jgi:hypothetical protein
LNHAPDGIFHCGDLFDAGNDVAQFRFIQNESFIERFRDAGGFRFRKIFLIRLKNRRCILAQRCGEVFSYRGAVHARSQFEKRLSRAFGLLSSFVHR